MKMYLFFKGQCFWVYGPGMPPGVAEDYCKDYCEAQDECFSYRVEQSDPVSSKCWIENSTGTSSVNGMMFGVEGGPLPC